LVNNLKTFQNRRQNIFNRGSYICAGELDILKI